jgi:hypothetical protein
MFERLLVVGTIVAFLVGMSKFGSIVMTNSPLCKIATCDAITYMGGGFLIFSISLMMLMFVFGLIGWIIKGN